MPKEMRNMAEAGLQQTRKTFDKLLTGAEAAAGSMEQRGATVGAAEHHHRRVRRARRGRHFHQTSPK